MDFLRKILLVAIISVFAGNAEIAQVAAQTEFNLPDNTPGLMKDKRQRKICGQDKACVHVIVPGTEAHKIFLLGNSDDDECGAIESALYKSGNIYFPADGTQPTTEEAELYSCANTVSDHVTNWYIRAFGGDSALEFSCGKATQVIDNNSPKMGYNTDNTPAHIMTVDEVTPVNFKQQFWQTFRIIASNPIGRVLLYRILIEIRRLNESKCGCVDHDVLIQSKVMLDARNRDRCIKICMGKATFKSGMHIAISFGNEYRNVISEHEENNSIEIIKYIRKVDCDLFHEILHLFHSLRDHKRYTLDTNSIGNFPYSPKSESAILVGKYRDNSIYEIDIAEHYYGAVSNSEPNTDERRAVSAKIWKPCYEEIRTILGVPINYSKHFRNGDELSENLYRISNKNPIRFGHVKLNIPDSFGNHQYFEDKKVIERHIDSLLSTATVFFIDKSNLFYPKGTDIKLSRLSKLQNGLGNCAILSYKR